MALAYVKNNVCAVPDGANALLLKGGYVVDPQSCAEDFLDIYIADGKIAGVGRDLKPQKGDGVIDCTGLQVWPGLIDMHLHLYDLFDVSTAPADYAACHGVTLGLSPGAGNTFMAPALMGAEVDRGLPIHTGVFVGGAAALASGLSADELVQVLQGRANASLLNRLSLNPITQTTAPLLCGIKDHMGHFVLSDGDIDTLFEVASRVGLPLMSHTQNVDHTARLVTLSRGRNLHLGHVTAAGGGEEGAANLQTAIDLIAKHPNVSGEFVSSMILPGGGTREGMRLSEPARQVALAALAAKTVDVLVSDGQSGATMKGFGDTRDNIPAILYLYNSGTLSLRDAVATMTANPARLLAKLYKNSWYSQKLGHLGLGARANVTVVEPNTGRAVYTITDGHIVAFEGKMVRRGYGSGCLATRFGLVKRTGVGDLPMFATLDTQE
ncbi:MAG: hydrolase [Oscillospiraceae bacterium]|nr:hydrolase [Oscillospiraceae bacterium]